MERAIETIRRLTSEERAARDRRERIATAAMQGSLVNKEAWENPNKAAKWAVQFADALIAELDGE